MLVFFFHISDVQSHRDQANILVVPDIDEPFVPLCDNMFVHPAQSRYTVFVYAEIYRVNFSRRNVITKVLEDIPMLYQENYVAESALGSLVSAGLSALVSRLSLRISCNS